VTLYLLHALVYTRVAHLSENESLGTVRATTLHTWTWAHGRAEARISVCCWIVVRLDRRRYNYVAAVISGPQGPLDISVNLEAATRLEFSVVACVHKHTRGTTVATSFISRHARQRLSPISDVGAGTVVGSHYFSTPVPICRSKESDADSVP